MFKNRAVLDLWGVNDGVSEGSNIECAREKMKGDQPQIKVIAKVCKVNFIR
jgi:hypothetical protein